MRFAGQSIQGTAAEDALRSSQGLDDMAGVMGREVGQSASITMDPVDARRNFIDDGDPSVYTLNERGDKKRQTMNAAEGEAIGLPREYMANPIRYQHERGVTDFPNAQDRRMPDDIRMREYLKLQKSRVQGRPVKDIKLQDVRLPY